MATSAIAAAAATVVPNLVGQALPEAHDTALDADLLAVAQPLGIPAASRGRHVGHQEPPPGRTVPPGQHVQVWVVDDRSRPSN